MRVTVVHIYGIQRVAAVSYFGYFLSLAVSSGSNATIALSVAHHRDTV